MTEKHDPEKLKSALDALNAIGGVVLDAAPIIAMLAGPEAAVFLKLGKPVIMMLQKHFNNLGRGDFNLALKDIKLGNKPFADMLKEAKLGGYLDAPKEEEPEDDDDDAIIVDDPDEENDDGIDDESNDESTTPQPETATTPPPPPDTPNVESGTTEGNETPSEGAEGPPPETDPTES